MKIYKEKSLSDFEFWSGARDRADVLTNEQFDQIEAILEDMYPDGCEDTFINDLFWFEPDTIAEWLGYRDWEALENGDDAGSIEEKLNDGGYALSNGAKVEFTTTYYDDNKFFGESEDINGDTISSSGYEYDGDIDDLAQRIIDDLEAQVNPEDIEGCKGVGAMYYDLRSENGRAVMYYGKATVIDDKGKLQLKSYNTIVAEYNKRTKVLTVFGWYSMTTSRHIREFARQLGIELPAGRDIAGKYKA